MKFKRYAAYKDPRVKLLSNIPTHWDVQKLKHIASVRFSNVDKKTEDGERAALLCNYQDVYYNDYITPDIAFMEATASPAEITSFMLRKGDVIVTKDSESWDDIAVSAYVPSDLDGVLCGYHLAHIHPYSTLIDGEYLFRSFSAHGINDQFRVAATGITRYGLGKYWLDNAFFPVPPIDEQHAIKTFLNRETAKIDALIEKKEKLIGLLQEKQNALITHAVTKGLAPNVPMKDSGVEWLGEIPAHWEVKRVKRLFRVFNGSTPKSSEPNYWDGDITWVTPDDLGTLSSTEILQTSRYITKSGYNSCGTTLVPKGSLVLSTRAPIGHLAIAGLDLCTNQGCRCLVFNNTLDHKYYYYQLDAARSELESWGQGSTFKELGKSHLEYIHLIEPPYPEQNDITAYLDRETAKIDALITKTRETIEKLKEYRIALISAAVTGKIDVREEAA